MKVVDGSFGEGGGQILRSALALAAVLGEPVRIENIRARRAKPGLGLQHLAAARAVARICEGKLQGLERGSRELVFEPGTLRPGRYAFEIGSAGSTTLVFQTLLPALAAAAEESVVTIHGGTHNPLAPPAEFLAESFLPTVAEVGLSAEVELIRHGFYPKGGGALRAKVRPWRERRAPLDWTKEVEWSKPEASILIANLPEHVSEREKMELVKRLGLPPQEIKMEALPGEVGPGNAVIIRLFADQHTAVITAFGEPGKKAERVANEASRDALKLRRSRAPVGPHLADQLLLPLALGPGGRFLTSEITEHTRTQAEILRLFLGLHIEFSMQRPETWLVEVPGANFLPRSFYTVRNE